MSNQEERDFAIELGNALNRLRENPDFKLVIEDGYFRDKALDSVSLLGVPQIKEQNRRGDVIEDLVAISNLQYYFRMIDSMYQGAADPILTDEEMEQMETGVKQ